MISLWGVIKGLLVKGESDRSKQVSLEIDNGATTNTRTTIRASQTANRTIDLPDATDTLVGRATADTLSNKTIDNSNAVTLEDSSFTLQDDADNTKQAQFNLSGLTTATTRTVSLPDDDTTLVGTDTTQTLENKTMDFTSATGNNTISADAVDLTFDNATSGLTATDVQAALDEIDSAVDDVATNKLEGPGTHGDNLLLKTDGTNTNVMQVTTIAVDDLNNVTGIVDLTTTGDVVVGGDLQVNGTLTSVNSATLEVTDANVIVNNGGNQASANSQGAGFTVEMSDATDAGIAYDSTLTSKFKVGEIGSQVEIVGTSSSQTLTNKTIDADNNTISNLEHGAEVDDPSSGVHGVTGDIVGTTDAQVLTSKDIDGGTASNTSRITIPKDTKANLDALTRKEATIVYASDLDKFFGDDGAELFEIGSGGEGGKNYFEGGNFEVNDDLASSYDDGGAYVDGTGGTPSFISFAVNSTTPLAGDSDLAITKAIGNAVGEGVTFLSTTIDRADLGKDLSFQFEYDFTDSDYTSGDVQIKAYDVTNAAILPVIAINNLGDDAGLLKLKAKAYGKILCNPTTAQVRLSLHVQTDSGTGVNWTGYVDDLKLAPNSIFQVVSTGPVGEIIAFGDDQTPENFLYCNGSTVSRTTYADLFAVIGTNFGSGDGSTTFHLPDLRGRFLRGQADGQSTDPDRASRTAMNSGGNTGDNIGSIQGDATSLPNTSFTTGVESASHTHAQTEQRGGTGGTFLAAAAAAFTAGNNVQTGTQSANHTHTVTSGGDNETRPVNAYVRYYIRFRGESNVLSANEIAVKTASVILPAQAPTGTLSAAWNKVTFGTKNIDTFNAYNTSTGVWTAPVSGIVQVSMNYEHLHSSSTGTIGARFRNTTTGTSYITNAEKKEGNDTTSYVLSTGLVPVTKGHTYEFQSFSSLTLPTWGLSFTASSASINYVPDFTVFGQFGETEYKEVILSANTNFNNGSDVDITGAAIPLTPGEWEIEYYMHCFWDWTSGASIGAGASIGVYNSANTFVAGSLGGAYNILNNNDDQVGQVITSKTRVILSSPDTYKLRGRQNVPTANVQVSVEGTASIYNSKMIARRVR